MQDQESGDVKAAIESIKAISAADAEDMCQGLILFAAKSQQDEDGDGVEEAALKALIEKVNEFTTLAALFHNIILGHMLIGHDDGELTFRMSSSGKQHVENDILPAASR